MINKVFEYLYSRVRLKGTQTRFYEFLSAMDNPELKLKAITIAGTNGKGSVTNYITDILLGNGYKVGTFTSPHLNVHNDRIRVNNVNISDEQIINYYDNYHNLWDEYNLSMFEIDLFMAITFFNEMGVDIGVFEAGIGARLDVTNCLYPIVSVITNVSYDHQELLGNTISKIAYQKAGIIKERTPVFTAERKEEALKEIKIEAIKWNSFLFVINPVGEYTIEDNKIVFIYKGIKYTLNTLAEYQIANACLAMSVTDYLKTIGYSINNTNTVTALEKSNWAGRFEIVSSKPMIVIDGAHNIAGIESLVKSLRNIKKDKTILFSAMADKDYDKMIELLKSEFNDVTICTFNSPRGFDISTIDRESIRVINDYKDAISTLSKEAKQANKCLVITGSLYFISAVRNMLINQ